LQPRLQEILIPLKVMLNGDDAMSEALAGFVHRLQDNLYYRRKESFEGKVLMALLELHDEDLELSSQNIADRIAQSDEDSEINSRKVGWVIKKLGLVKERVGKNRQRVIRWDQDRVQRLSQTYGLSVPREKTPETSALSALASEMADDVDLVVEDCPPERPPDSEAGPGVTADNADIADNLCEDMRTASDAIEPVAGQETDPLEEFLHMTREQIAGAGSRRRRHRWSSCSSSFTPDTAGVKGTDFLLQMMIAAYQQIAKERGKNHEGK